MLDLSIIIVSYNTRQLTLACLASIYKYPWKSKLEIIVVDNSSEDGSKTAIKKVFPQVKLIESNTNLGFTGGNNLGIKHSNGEYILLLNSDTIVYEDALDKLLAFAKRSKFQIVSCKLLNQDGSFQPNGGYLPRILPLFVWLSGLDDIFRQIIDIPSYQERRNSYYKNGQEFGWVSGAVMLINSLVIKKIGAFDDNIFMYGEDVELCWRAKLAGFKIGWTDESKIMHLGGGSSTNPRLNQWKGEFRGLIYLYNKYYGKLFTIVLAILINIFILIRVVLYYLIGKNEYAKTYRSIFNNF